MGYYRDSNGDHWVDGKRIDPYQVESRISLRPNPYDPEKLYSCYDSSNATWASAGESAWIGDLRAACTKLNDLLPEGYSIDVGYDDQYRNQALIYGPNGIIAKTEY